MIFLQAENGIRDIGVTGVQTCALPILRAVLGGDGDRVRWREPGRRSGGWVRCSSSTGVPRRPARRSQRARLLTGNDLDDRGEGRGNRSGDSVRLAAYLRFEAASTEVFRPYGQPWGECVCTTGGARAS